jgi:hypothetical protein
MLDADNMGTQAKPEECGPSRPKLNHECVAGQSKRDCVAGSKLDPRLHIVKGCAFGPQRSTVRAQMPE